MDTVLQPSSQPRTKRRYRSAGERRHVVEETLVPGASVAIVGRAHGVNANQVFAWASYTRLEGWGVRTRYLSARPAQVAFACCQSPSLGRLSRAPADFGNQRNEGDGEPAADKSDLFFNRGRKCHRATGPH